MFLEMERMHRAKRHSMHLLNEATVDANMTCRQRLLSEMNKSNESDESLTKGFPIKQTHFFQCCDQCS